MYINNLGHMTKMAAMPIYGKNPSKIFFSETNRLISRKLGVKHRWLKYSNVYINHDPVMTLTKFMARSTWVAYAFELGKLLKCHLKGNASRKLANGQNIEDSEKRKWPKGFICPCTGVKQGSHGQGKVREKCKKFKVREKSGNFEISQGNLKKCQKSGKSQGISESEEEILK